MPWIIGLGSVAGGLIAANSASNAADTQGAATDKAVGASQAQYDKTRADLAPYRDAGAQALSRLSQLLGVGPQATVGGTPTFVQSDPAATAWRASQLRLNPQGFMDTGPDGVQFLNTDGHDPGAGAVGTNGVQGQATTGGTPDPAYGSLLRDFAPSDLNADPIYKSALDFSTTQGEKAINARRAATGGYDSGAALKELGTFNLGNAASLGENARSAFNNNRSAKYGMLTGLSGTGLSAAGATSNAGTANSVNLSNLYTGQGNAAAAAGIAGGNAISGGINSAIGNYNSQNLLAQLSGGGQRRASAPIGEYNMAPGF